MKQTLPPISKSNCRKKSRFNIRGTKTAGANNYVTVWMQQKMVHDQNNYCSATHEHYLIIISEKTVKKQIKRTTNTKKDEENEEKKPQASRR